MLALRGLFVDILYWTQQSLFIFRNNQSISQLAASADWSPVCETVLSATADVPERPPQIELKTVVDKRYSTRPFFHSGPFLPFKSLVFLGRTESKVNSL